jgi:hypothetical protein
MAFVMQTAHGISDRLHGLTTMQTRQAYVKRSTEFVVAVKVDLETEGFTYRKWGAWQTCKAGDWLVNNAGDTYTVDGDTFVRTYRSSGAGTYVKTTPVWAETASAAGEMPIKEGKTHHEAGDYLVYNEPDGGDGYAVPKAVFERMYERLESTRS